MEILSEFFDKKSPILIITLTTLIAAIISLTFPLESTCPYSPQLHLFILTILLQSSLQILVKVLGLQIFKKVCPNQVLTIHNIIILLFLVIDVAILIWGIFLLARVSDECIDSQPHLFMLQVYVFVFALVYVGVLGLVISLWLENKVVTVLEDEEQEGKGQYEPIL